MTLRERFAAIDDFLPAEEADLLRGDVDTHFADPYRHRPDSHQVWNYWHVPGLYTYLRTSPEKVIASARIERFHDALSAWARDTLGLGHVTWPNLSLYVDGCMQGLHNDATNGRFGYVYSLTRDDRNGAGGETIILHEGDLFRSKLTSAAAGSGLYDLIAPRFNRLAIFDDRIPHGVQRIEGTMDPVAGRIVLHGHISESGPFATGPLPAEMVAEAVGRVAAESGEGNHGPLVLRLRIAADGAVGDVELLVDRVAGADGVDGGGLTARIVDKVRVLRFDAQDAETVATVPLLFGGELGGIKRVGAQPSGDAALRAKGAEAVRARLAENPEVHRLPVEPLEICLGRDFLSAEECAGLIALIDADRKPSGLLAEDPDPEFRTSESCNLSRRDPLVQRVEAKISALTGIAPELGETIQGQRYAVGQQFKPHHDFFHTDQPYWPTQQALGGQRTWTVMMFLNAPEAGGQTAFPQAELKVTPRAGNVLLWNNMDAAGEPNPASLHQGMPVAAGIKYVITKWYRERAWANSPLPSGERVG